MIRKRRLRAEWEPQSAILVAWPHEGTDWRPDLELAEAFYLRMVEEIASRQPVIVLANDEETEARIRRLTKPLGLSPERICLQRLTYNDTWTRDYGPLAVDDDGACSLLDFRFNGWGGKFHAKLDDRVSDTLQGMGVFGDTLYHHLPWVLEGGALETDGQGTLLATKSSVLSESRNPGVTQKEIEIMLGSELGIRHFLWLEHGVIEGDDTDGHIDTLARFANPETILFSTAEDGDPDHPQLARMAQDLSAMRTAQGRPIRLIPLPPAGIHRDEDGRRLPASYANFLILNDCLLAPVYGHQNDASAMEILQQAFPGRPVISIDCQALIRQNGSLHCATMQLPENAYRCVHSKR